MERNTIKLNEVPGYSYGRRIAYTSVAEITENNLAQILANGISVHNSNKATIKYLWNYYKGDQPARYRVKTVRDDVCNNVVENHAFEIVRYKTAHTFGEPIQYISRKDDETINKSVDRLNDYMVDVNKYEKDLNAGTWQSAVGTSFKAVQRADSENSFRIVAPSPMNTFVIYSSVTEEPMLAAQEIKTDDNELLYICYSKTMQYIVSDLKIVEGMLHAFGDLPIVEIPNNFERLSDIELVITMLDALNDMQSNRVDSIAQFVQSWIKFVNCNIDEEEFEKMKKLGALVVKSNTGTDHKADVEVMSQELNQTQTQVAKDDIWGNVLNILSIPNKEGGTKGGDSQGAVELREGWNFAKNSANFKDIIVKASEKRLAKVVLNVLRVNGKTLNITTTDFDVQINHSPTDNIIVKCQSLQYLLKCGIHPLVAIKTIGLWGDAEKVYLNSKPYLDNLWKVSDNREFDVEEQTKKVDLFVKCLNAGMSIEDAGKHSDITVADNSNFKKWEYDA